MVSKMAAMRFPAMAIAIPTAVALLHFLAQPRVHGPGARARRRGAPDAGCLSQIACAQSDDWKRQNDDLALVQVEEKTEQPKQRVSLDK